MQSTFLNSIYQLMVKARSKVLVYLTHRMALPILRLIRKPEAFPYTRQQLQALPLPTLGKALATMLEENEFELLTHYAKHDMKHILLDYPTTDKGEVCLQAFMCGNGHLSFPVISTLLFGFLTMPEYWKAFYKAWQRGKAANKISHWNWVAIVNQPTTLLQQQIFNTPTTNYANTN
jgi:ubiquinone biosynthesis protein Coq4